MLEDVAEYQSKRIAASAVDEATYVGVDNLLPDKKGKKDSEHVPAEGSIIGFSKGDILIGNIRPYLRKIWLADLNGGTNGDVLAIHIKGITDVFPRYLYYVLSSEDFFIYDTNHSKGAKMPRGDKATVMKYSFMLPGYKRQVEVAELLDKFESICNDISEGLPAEIEARQKQYEYYRDKLLSFKEAQN